MGGVLVSTHSSLALAWTWDAVLVRTTRVATRVATRLQLARS
jgi:hypothetical protein